MRLLFYFYGFRFLPLNVAKSALPKQLGMQQKMSAFYVYVLATYGIHFFMTVHKILYPWILCVQNVRTENDFSLSISNYDPFYDQKHV